MKLQWNCLSDEVHIVSQVAAVLWLFTRAGSSMSLWSFVRLCVFETLNPLLDCLFCNQSCNHEMHRPELSNRKSNHHSWWQFPQVTLCSSLFQNAVFAIQISFMLMVRPSNLQAATLQATCNPVLFSQLHAKNQLGGLDTHVLNLAGKHLHGYCIDPDVLGSILSLHLHSCYVKWCRLVHCCTSMDGLGYIFLQKGSCSGCLSLGMEYILFLHSIVGWYALSYVFISIPGCGNI